MSESQSDQEKIAAFTQLHPEIGRRFASMIDVMNNANGDMNLVDDADERMVEELRKLGKTAMTTWAEERVEAADKQAITGSDMRRERKKKRLSVFQRVNDVHESLLSSLA